MKPIALCLVAGLALSTFVPVQAQEPYYAAPVPGQPVYQQPVVPVVPVTPVPAYDWTRDVEQARRHLEEAKQSLARLPPDYHRDEILGLIQQAEARLPATPPHHYH